MRVTKPTKKDVLSFSIALALALGFPCLVLIFAGGQGLGLALQDLGFSVFQITCLPLSVMCFARAFDLAQYRKLEAWERATWTAVLSAYRYWDHRDRPDRRAALTVHLIWGH